MNELLQLVKSLTDSLDSIVKVQTQQSKTVSELAKLCDAKEVPPVAAARVKDLAESQDMMVNMMSFHIKAMKQQAMVVLSKPHVVAMPPEQQGQSSSSPKFGRLPVEIRKLIWEMALPDGRVIELTKACFAVGELQKRYRPPTIRAVCKEAWAITELNGRFVCGSNFTPLQGTWYNPRKDAVIVNEPGDSMTLGPIRECNPEILAFDFTYFKTPQDIAYALEFAALETPSCRKILILVRSESSFKYSSETTPKLFSLRPNEVIYSGYGDDIPEMLEGDFDVSWSDLKSEIEAFWDAASDEFSWIGRIKKQRGLPIIEGMELIMCKEDRASLD